MLTFLQIIALACSPASDKLSCEKKFNECLEFVYSQPIVKEKSMTKDDVALWLDTTDSRARKNLCGVYSFSKGF